PESVRSSLRHRTTGARLSSASTDVPRTPLGKAVTDRPSLRGRAPEPPLLNDSSEKGAAVRLDGSVDERCASGPPRSCSDQIQNAPLAGTVSGMICARQPNTTSGSIWPITWRAATGAGHCTLTIDPTGPLVSITFSEPALLGTSGASAARMANAE